MELIRIVKNKKLADPYYDILHVAHLAYSMRDHGVYKYIFSNEKELVSTDSKSLHVSKVEMKPGFYSVLQCKADRAILLHYEGETIEGMHYPDYTKIIPVLHNAKKIEIELPIKTYKTNILKKYRAYTKLLRSINPRIFIDLGYLEKLRGDFDVYDCTDATNIFRPLVFESKNKCQYAYIMPAQYEREV